MEHEACLEAILNSRATSARVAGSGPRGRVGGRHEGHRTRIRRHHPCYPAASRGVGSACLGAPRSRAETRRENSGGARPVDTLGETRP
jgi:hypothetical protein